MAARIIPRILMICVIMSLTICVVITNQAHAYDGGTGDQNNDCIGCHALGGSGTIDLITPMSSVVTNQTNITLSVIVNADFVDSDAGIVGVMLLTKSLTNITEDGWIILEEPNANSQKFNYNEMTITDGDLIFNWAVTAPMTEGDYTLKARMMYDDSGSKYLETEPRTISVVKQAGNTDDSHNGSGGQENGSDPSILDVSDPRPLTFALITGMASVMLIVIFRRRWYE